MSTVERQAGESLESMLKRFRRKLSHNGRLRYYRRKQYYISKSELKREKIRRGIRRHRRKLRRQQESEGRRGF